MIVIGLTGGIGMGKSTTARLFAEEGVPVWDADAAVHRLYAKGGAAVAPVLAQFDGIGSVDGGIDRPALSALLMAEPDRLKTLEAIVHPLVRQDRLSFIEEHRVRGTPVVLCDIPLLFEAGYKDDVDVIVLCTAPEDVRRERVLARPRMTAEKLGAIIARQWPEADKRAGADYLIRTDGGIEAAGAEVRAVLKAIVDNPPSPRRPESD